MADASTSSSNNISSRERHQEFSSSPNPTTSDSLPSSSSINSLLDTFETAWMGGPKTSAKSALSSLLQDSGERNGSQANGGYRGGVNSDQSQSGGQISHPLMTAWTQVPASTAQMPVISKRPHEGEDEDGLAMLPMTPFPSHMLKSLGGDGPPAANGHVATPVPMPAATLGMKAAPGTGQPGQDFAPVFFSPIPMSYLNIARSESESSFLDSVGSPDLTLRGGRLAKAGSGEWCSDAAAGSAQLAGSPTSGSQLLSSRQGNRSRLSPEVTSFPLGSISEVEASGSAANGGIPQNLPSAGPLGSGGKPASGALGATALQHPLLSRPPVISSASTLSNPPSFSSLIPSTVHPYPLDATGPPSVIGGLVSGGLSIAAAAAAAGRRHNQGSGVLRLVAGTAMIPHIDKVRGYARH